MANVKTDKGPWTKVMHRWIMGVCHEFGRLIKNQCMPLLFWRLIYHASHVCCFFSSFFYPWRRVEKFFEISINDSNFRHVACSGKNAKTIDKNSFVRNEKNKISSWTLLTFLCTNIIYLQLIILIKKKITANSHEGTQFCKFMLTSHFLKAKSW